LWGLQMFRVGQKVVFIGGLDVKATLVALHYGFALPIEGAVYTVAAHHGGGKFIELTEIPATLGTNFISFLGSCFRPVVERKTDISILQALLVPGAKILDGVNG
jgi:hypothetical protein